VASDEGEGQDLHEVRVLDREQARLRLVWPQAMTAILLALAFGPILAGLVLASR